jgi:catechol-2,3-dioxygenase
MPAAHRGSAGQHRRVPESCIEILRLDHIVLCVADVQRSIAFYTSLLGMQPREERPGKWSLHFGPNKISLPCNTVVRIES